MQVAIDQFRVNLARVRNLGGIYNTLNAQTTAVIDLSDILRSELVMVVSVLDYYIHETVRLGMLEVYRGIRPETSAFLRFQISLESVRQAVSDLTNDNWLDNEIRERHGWRSFQQADHIAEAIRLISNINLWEQVSNYLGMPAQEIRQQLNLIADRRNKIVHEADMNPTPYNTRWPIDEALVDDAINFIEQIAETIHNLLTT